MCSRAAVKLARRPVAKWVPGLGSSLMRLAPAHAEMAVVSAKLGRGHTSMAFCRICFQSDDADGGAECEDLLANCVAGAFRENFYKKWMFYVGARILRPFLLTFIERKDAYRQTLNCGPPDGVHSDNGRENSSHRDHVGGGSFVPLDGDELICPCACKGSMEYVHRKCLNTWRYTLLIQEMTKLESAFGTMLAKSKKRKIFMDCVRWIQWSHQVKVYASIEEAFGGCLEGESCGLLEQIQWWWPLMHRAKGRLADQNATHGWDQSVSSVTSPNDHILLLKRAVMEMCGVHAVQFDQPLVDVDNFLCNFVLKSPPKAMAQPSAAPSFCTPFTLYMTSGKEDADDASYSCSHVDGNVKCPFLVCDLCGTPYKFCVKKKNADTNGADVVESNASDDGEKARLLPNVNAKKDHAERRKRSFFWGSLLSSFLVYFLYFSAVGHVVQFVGKEVCDHPLLRYQNLPSPQRTIVDDCKLLVSNFYRHFFDDEYDNFDIDLYCHYQRGDPVDLDAESAGTHPSATASPKILVTKNGHPLHRGHIFHLLSMKKLKKTPIYPQDFYNKYDLDGYEDFDSNKEFSFDYVGFMINLSAFLLVSPTLLVMLSFKVLSLLLPESFFHYHHLLLYYDKFSENAMFHRHHHSPSSFMFLMTLEVSSLLILLFFVKKKDFLLSSVLFLIIILQASSSTSASSSIGGNIFLVYVGVLISLVSALVFVTMAVAHTERLFSYGSSSCYRRSPTSSTVALLPESAAQSLFYWNIAPYEHTTHGEATPRVSSITEVKNANKPTPLLQSSFP